MQNQPVAVNSAIGGIALLLASVFARLGINADGWGQILQLLVAAVGALVALWRVVVAQRLVTPVANPKNNAGQPLTPDTPPIVAPGN